MDRRCLLRRAGLLVAISGCSNDPTEVGDDDETDEVFADDAGSSTEGGSDTGAEEEGSEGNGSEEESAGETEDGSEPGPPVSSDVVPRPVPGAWPSAVFGTDQYLVVWEDHRRPRPVLYGGRVAADGTALDPLGFPLLDAVPTSEDVGTYRPDVAFDGENYLVVAQAGKQIRGVRVSPAGNVLDPKDFTIAILETGSVSRPSLAFDGEHYMVAWSQWVNANSEDNGVHRARVAPDGTVLDPKGVKVDGLGYYLSTVGVSFDGGNTLLSSESVDADTNAVMIAAARIAPDGTQIDEDPLQVSPLSLDIEHDVGTAAGFDGTNHVIAWVDGEISDTYRVLASRVTPDGTVLDPQGIEAIVEPGEGANVHRLDLSASHGRSIVVLSTDYDGEGGPGARTIRVAEITTEVRPARIRLMNSATGWKPVWRRIQTAPCCCGAPATISTPTTPQSSERDSTPRGSRSPTAWWHLHPLRAAKT
jgi:hypothetical protein